MEIEKIYNGISEINENKDENQEEKNKREFLILGENKVEIQVEGSVEIEMMEQINDEEKVEEKVEEKEQQ